MLDIDTDGIEAKLFRANEHLEALENELVAWINIGPYSTVRKVDAQQTRYSVVMDRLVNPDFRRLSLITADCLQNLRAVLDHLVYAIAIIQTPAMTKKQRKSVAFPIIDAPKDFPSVWQKIESLSQPVRAAIESVQPYRRPHHTLPPLLTVLRNLNDTDKHKLLQLAVARTVQSDFKDVRGIPPGQTFSITHHLGNIERGTEVCALIFDRPTPDVSYEYGGTFVVGISGADMPRVVELADVAALIHVLRDEVLSVADIVLAAAMRPCSA